jgi:arylsulfatase A-like enzyme
LRENTIVVFWGDHGYYMGEHSWWGSKHNNYEGATKVPLIIRAPGMKRPGASTDALVELIDLFPTLVQLAGLPPASGVEGDSLVPLLEDPTASWNKPAFSSYPKQGYLGKAMRTERFRYVEWSRDGKVEAVELYDHQKDPQENQNVAGDPAYAQAVEELAARMQAELN